VSDLQRQLIDTHQITINFAPGPDFGVYCSKLFRQHLYNLLDNSLFWIVKKRGVCEQFEGNITVTIGAAQQTETGQSQSLNQRCRITVRDNGPGVSDVVLKDLREFPLNYTNRRYDGGSGYGLWALRQYADTLAAWIDLDSVEGEFFEVAILLDIFNDKIHKQKKWGKGW
jgi:signal transduction histidine kinase